MPDSGRAQLQAMRSWKLELENISATLDFAINRSTTEFLLLIARHMRTYFNMAGSSYIPRDRYQRLVRVAHELADLALLRQVQLGLGAAHTRLGNYTAAQDSLSHALQLPGPLSRGFRGAQPPDGRDGGGLRRHGLGDFLHGLNLHLLLATSGAGWAHSAGSTLPMTR